MKDKITISQFERICEMLKPLIKEASQPPEPEECPKCKELKEALTAVANSKEHDEVFDKMRDVGKFMGQPYDAAYYKSKGEVPPEPNKPLRVPLPDDFLKERNRKVEEMKSWSWQYDEGWSDCEDWLRLNQKKFDKEFVNEVEAMISASPEPNTNVLKQILLVLDNYLGDTDPDIGENWTDEDIKHEEPILWAHMKLVDMISEPNTVTEEDFKKYLYDKFMKVLPDLAFKEILSEGYADDIIEWLQQTQAVTELTYVECSERQATHYVIKEPGDSACYPVKLLNQKK